VRRHQAIVVSVGVGLVGDWFLRRRASLAEVLVGTVLALGAMPVADGLTLAEWALVVVRYASRSHWRHCGVLDTGDECTVWAGPSVSVRTFELEHRGRLDLSGRDEHVARALANVVDALGAARARRHVSVHVLSDPPTTTVLALPLDARVPEGWRRATGLAPRLLGTTPGASREVLERWRYLRSRDGVLCVFRVLDYNAVAPGRALLHDVLRRAQPSELSLHLDVVGGVKAQRQAARAVHRTDSDDAASRAAGFRRSARSARHLGRLAQREALVASGRALTRIAVFVVVRASTLGELRSRSDEVWRRAHDGGLRLQRGVGRQAPWWSAQLPGGPSW